MNRCARASTTWLDGRPADAATLAALQFNYGHVSTMQVRGGAVQGLRRHVARLQSANLALFGSELPAGRIRDALVAALRAVAVDDASLRVSVVAADASAVEHGDVAAVTLLVGVSPPRTAPVDPQRLCSHRLARVLPGLKHLGTLPQLHARRVARAAGFDDALLVDAAERVLEGTMWNIGFVDADGIVWPEADALRGVTEGLLRAALETAGIAQRTRPLHCVELAGFRAAFACNSRGLWPLAAIDHMAFAGDPAMLARLQGLLATAPWESLAI